MVCPLGWLKQLVREVSQTEAAEQPSALDRPHRGVRQGWGWRRTTGPALPEGRRSGLRGVGQRQGRTGQCAAGTALPATIPRALVQKPGTHLVPFLLFL